jgi:DNA-binding beta-propeller fold protein YncE
MFSVNRPTRTFRAKVVRLLVVATCAACYFAIATQDADAHVGDFPKATELHGGDRSRAHALAVSPNGETFSFGAGDRVSLLNLNGTGGKLAHSAETLPPELTDEMLFPLALAYSPDGKKLYVADQVMGRVLELDSNGSSKVLVGNRATVNSQYAPNNERLHVTALAVSPDGRTVFATTNSTNSILKIAADGTRVDVVHSPTINPRALALSPDGKTLFVATTSRERDRGSFLNDPKGSNRYVANPTVFAIPLPGGEAKAVVGGNGVGNRIDPTNPLNTQLADPSALALSPDGKTLYIADEALHRVLAASLDGTKIKIIAGGEFPAYAYPVDPFDATKTRLHFPAALATTPDGSLLIGDTKFDRVSGETSPRVLLVGADDEFEASLNTLITTRSKSDLRLLASPDPLSTFRAVSRSANGLDPDDTDRRSRQLRNLEPRDIGLIQPQSTTHQPREIWKLITDLTKDDRAHPIRQFRARLALRILREAR